MLIDTLLKNETNFPQTIIFNEGWLLRIVLNWVFENNTALNQIDYVKESSWFSEGLLSSPFHHRSRNDKLAEGKTHADGVTGHFIVSEGAKADIRLKNQGTYFAIFEAKLFSNFSPGTKYFPTYNQVSRNIACMAYLETINPHDSYSKFVFSVTYPRERRLESDFLASLDKDKIAQDVYNRIENYEFNNRSKEYDKLSKWYRYKFLDFLNNIEIRKIKWESIIEDILSHDSEFGKKLNSYYKKCLLHNRKHNNAFRADG